jgi:uncharacterized membrane protein
MLVLIWREFYHAIPCDIVMSKYVSFLRVRKEHQLHHHTEEEKFHQEKIKENNKKMISTIAIILLLILGAIFKFALYNQLFN